MSGKKDDPKVEPKVFMVDPNTMKELEKDEEKPSGFLGEILSELKKFESNSKKDENNHKIKMAFDIEPDKMRIGAAIGVGVYRNKVELLPDEILKRIAGPGGDDLVCQILQTRSNHISNFGRPRDNRFDIGFDLLPKDKSKLPKDPEEMASLMMRVEKVKEKIWKCGGPIRGEAETPTFSQYLKMITRDGLLYGRHATIMINNEEDKSFWAFRAADAGTIYKTVKYRDQDNAYRKQALQKLKDIYQLTGKDFDEKAYLTGDYVYVQVIRGKPEQMFTSDEMVVHNLYPTTNVEYNGYPLTPIDQVIHAVTTHIDITMSNKLWFQHGRAARGMIVVKARGVNDQILQTMRSQFQQTINSVRNAHRMPVFGIGPEDEIDWKPIDNSSRDMEFQYLSENNARVIMGAYQISPDELPGYGHLSKGSNSQSLAECLDPETQILTPNGLESLSDILGQDNSKNTKVWNGVKWVESKVFFTKEKDLKETILDTNISIKSSPDHYFQVIGSSGEPEWKPQSQLTVGDYVLTNKNKVEGIGQIPEFNNKKLTTDIMEILGWMTGDGTLVSPRKRAGGQIHLFYHHNKERNIWKSHCSKLESFGINLKSKEKFLSDKEMSEIKTRYGFKSVSNSRIKNIIYDTKFTNWLLELGFKPSKEGKIVPKFIYSLPSEYRQAFLRGLFSADGHVSKKSNGSVLLTASNNKIRSQTRDLLLTLGIRTNSYEGTTKQIFVGNKRKTVPFKNKLLIKDKRLFFKEVGFLQAHKQPENRWLEGNDPQQIPQSTQEKYINLLINSSLPRQYKKSLYRFASGNPKSKISAPRLCGLMNIANIEIPGWLTGYHFDKIASLIDHDKKILMADLTVYDESHAFIANGFVVHNSNNEYKLEAARDVGIRPLLTGLQDAFNHSILPKIDEEISKNWAMVFCGLDHDNPEKESVRLQQDSNIWMTMNDILDVVEKDRLPKEIGGDLPLSPQFWQTITPHLTEGQIQEFFMGIKGAAKDPRLNFYRDPLWMQWQQMQQQEVQMRVQMLMQNIQQQQMSAMQPQLTDGSQPAGQDQGQPPQQQEQPQQDPSQQFGKSEDFVKASAELDSLKKKYN